MRTKNLNETDWHRNYYLFFEIITIFNTGTGLGTEIELAGKNNPISDEQKWFRSTADENGWFTLTNLNSGKLLTAPSSHEISATGKNTLLMSF